ncbi:unnamed protein product [Pieris macdunnoughi]|uniref:Uncharacterized protein n=1 Tax=Pieris macdunnoughi TaxID=345717 RepID=A0A821M710_9NEOP|nr:unnamed protein product [Pieris macdunnoughi]
MRYWFSYLPLYFGANFATSGSTFLPEVRRGLMPFQAEMVYILVGSSDPMGGANQRMAPLAPPIFIKSCDVIDDV